MNLNTKYFRRIACKS